MRQANCTAAIRAGINNDMHQWTRRHRRRPLGCVVLGRCIVPYRTAAQPNTTPAGLSQQGRIAQAQSPQMCSGRYRAVPKTAAQPAAGGCRSRGGSAPPIMAVAAPVAPGVEDRHPLDTRPEGGRGKGFSYSSTQQRKRGRAHGLLNTG